MIVGIDEVGRGCWAGPVCVGAVMLDKSTNRELLQDSKTLSPKKRLLAALHIKQTAVSVGIGWASAKYIDTYGLSRALSHATAKALAEIELDYDEIILDGTVNYLPENAKVTLLAKADSLIPAVSAASIIAKVARDNYMKMVDKHISGYGFSKHVGYGTAAHKAAIDRLGPSPVHRMSFAPLRAITNAQLPPRINNTAGSLAEARAAHYLEVRGYKIVAKNWKTKWCEIDIIARKQNYIYFIEVKYRANDSAGRGLEYITAKKQRQMKFAAEFWLQQQKVSLSSKLSALELSGPEFKVTAFVERIA